MAIATDSREISAALLQPCKVDVSVPEWQEAERAGWDMSLVRDALRGDVQRRVRQHQAALDLAESLRAAYLEQYGHSSSITRPYSMINVIELAFTCYPVTDLPRARAFYEGVIGLKPTMVNESEGGAWVEYEVASGAFAIGKWEGWPPSPVGASVAFEVEDFEGAIEKLKAAGVPFNMEAFETPVCHMAFVTDPDGSSICIHKRKPGHP